MKVPEDFKTRIAGNFYENTPNLVVCYDTPIFRLDRDEDSGELLVRLVVFDSAGCRKAVVEGTRITEGSPDEYSARMTDHSFKVREISTGRVICRIQRCAGTRDRDLDAFLMTHAPNGFFVHANPVQTNLGTRSTGQTYRNLDAAIVME